jgi:hypothetical protein
MKDTLDCVKYRQRRNDDFLRDGRLEAERNVEVYSNSVMSEKKKETTQQKR